MYGRQLSICFKKELFSTEVYRIGIQYQITTTNNIPTKIQHIAMSSNASNIGLKESSGIAYTLSEGNDSNNNLVPQNTTITTQHLQSAQKL